MSETTHLSLFSGYGGLDHAVEEVFGATTVAVSDIEDGPCKVLAERMPGVPNLGDITRVDWTGYTPTVGSGGSPCQDVSDAGKKAGMTEGTRSNLWVEMRRAIAETKPTFVVFENVRGILSARADSAMEREEGRVGSAGAGKLVLRALGRVLGDLADLGFDAEWEGVRASDVGAPHARFRVFVLAWHPERVAADTANHGREWGRQTRFGRTRPADSRDREPVALFPTPRATRGGSATETVDLLPTPRASDGSKGGPNQRGSKGDLMLPAAVHDLLPTPKASDGDFGLPRTSGRPPEMSTHLATRLEYTDFGQYAAAIARWEEILGRPAPPPTKVSEHSRKSCKWHAIPNDDRPSAEVQSVPGDSREETLPEREARGPGGIPAAEPLLAGVREHSDRGDQERDALACSEAPEAVLHDVPRNERPARASHRPEPRKQRPGEPRDPVRELPSEVALERGPEPEDGEPGSAECACKPQLNPGFAEWMMGLPLGWVTDPELGLSRVQQLRILGNGVVPQQATAALRVMIGRVPWAELGLIA